MARLAAAERSPDAAALEEAAREAESALKREQRRADDGTESGRRVLPQKLAEAARARASHALVRAFVERTHGSEWVATADDTDRVPDDELRALDAAWRAQKEAQRAEEQKERRGE